MPSFTLLITLVSVIVVIILVAYGLVIFGLRDVFFAGQDIGSRLETYVSLPAESTQRQEGQRRRSNLIRWRLRMNNMLSGLAPEKLNLQLISANWPITETEYVVIRYGSVIVAFGLGWIISKIFVSGRDVLVFGPGWTVSKMFVSGVGLAVIAFFIPELLLASAR